MTPERNRLEQDPRKLKEFWTLGGREQKAVDIALSGISQWRMTGEEPKPIKVTITPQNQFDLKAFANVLHSLSIDIASSLKGATADNKTIVTFQPKPYGGIVTLKEELGSAEAFFRNLRNKPY